MTIRVTRKEYLMALETIRLYKSQSSGPKRYDFIDRIIEAFSTVYEESNGVPYSIINRGKERAAVAKLLKEFQAKQPGLNTDDTLDWLSRYFKLVVNINDKWMRNNMTLPVLMAKFNEINNTIRNGRSVNTKGASDKEFFETVSKHCQ